VSKAFTRESDDALEAPVRRRGVPVPDGVPNYLTADGARALRAEHDRLATAEREPDAEARLHELTEHLGSAEIVEHPAIDQVGFGTRVTVVDEDGTRSAYALVGAIEAAPREGRLNWQSPLARALVGARVGDTVSLPRERSARVIAIDAA
jgi:transcription elongation factor GreB